mmetsp:Transcript_42896/g.104303  ORF Transcript_42896/g.104303 Transcript_42896/m.104303 type:complete len:232 (-) Transcript_42896:2528-3223(-)
MVTERMCGRLGSSYGLMRASPTTSAGRSEGRGLGTRGRGGSCTVTPPQVLSAEPSGSVCNASCAKTSEAAEAAAMALFEATRASSASLSTFEEVVWLIMKLLEVSPFVRAQEAAPGMPAPGALGLAARRCAARLAEDRPFSSFGATEACCRFASLCGSVSTEFTARWLSAEVSALIFVSIASCFSPSSAPRSSKLLSSSCICACHSERKPPARRSSAFRLAAFSDRETARS